MRVRVPDPRGFAKPRLVTMYHSDSAKKLALGKRVAFLLPHRRISNILTTGVANHPNFSTEPSAGVRLRGWSFCMLGRDLDVIRDTVFFPIQCPGNVLSPKLPGI